MSGIDVSVLVNCHHDGFAMDVIPIAAAATPRLYLDFANADLLDPDTERTRVNALSNAKRALHLQVDTLSDALGAQHSGISKRLSFPQKLGFCVQCGIVGPRIIQKLNQLRNSVEHDYYFPTRQETEDYVDVAALFIAATNHLLREFPSYVDVVSGEYFAGCFHMTAGHLTLTPGQGEITIRLARYLGEADEWQRQAKVLQQQLESAESSSADTHSPSLKLEEQAYREAMKENYREDTIVVSAKETAEYCKWASTMLSIVNAPYH